MANKIKTRCLYNNNTVGITVGCHTLLNGLTKVDDLLLTRDKDV